MTNQSFFKIKIGCAVFICSLIFSPHLGISETDEAAPGVDSVSSQAQQEPGSEDRQILQHELRVLMEERRSLVDGGAKASEIQEITQKIQEKSRRLASQPPLVSKMSADRQKMFDQQFLARKTKLDELGRGYKELIDKNAPKEQVEAIIKQINDARGEMQRFIQTSMQPSEASSMSVPQAAVDHSGHQH